MTQLTIEAGDVRITLPVTANLGKSETFLGEFNAEPRLSMADQARAQVVADAKVAGIRRIKVDKHGLYMPIDSTCTDHVAVLDTALNLLVYPCSIGVNGKRATQARLKKEIANLSVLGGGWRLAERFEAESILDLSRHNPAVDPDLFPGIEPAGHITNTAYNPAPASAAWWVFFDDGGVFVDDLVSFGWALAVRSAGQ